MPKKITKAAQIGDAGVALIHRRVNAMGFVWHERHIDAGIDGTIELRDVGTGAMSNVHLMVQSKASDRPFPGESAKGFHYLCAEEDLAYWMKAQEPVLLVCSHPSDGEAWWAHVQSWFQDPVRRASRRIDFDKATQRLDDSAARRLMNLADPHGFAHTPEPAARAEELVSNLLAVTQRPEVIYVARCSARPKDIADALRQAGKVHRDWTLREGKIYSLSHVDEMGLGDVVAGPCDALDPSDLLSSASADDHRLYVNLLNQGLQQQCVADLRYDPHGRYLHFKANPKLRDRSLRGSSNRSRKVFYGHTKKATGEINYYIHAALDWRFLDLDGAWFLALEPTWHYTSDGYRPHPFSSDLLAGRKRMDRNRAVLGHVRMWASYLRGEDHLLNERDDLLGFGDLVTFQVDQAIDDDAWTSQRPSTVAAEAARLARVAVGHGMDTLFGDAS